MDNYIFYGGTYAMYWALTCAPNYAASANAFGNFSTANYDNFTPVLRGSDIALTANPWTNPLAACLPSTLRRAVAGS